MENCFSFLEMRFRIRSQESWTLARWLYAWRMPGGNIWWPIKRYTLPAMPLPPYEPRKPVCQNLLTRTRRISHLWLFPWVRYACHYTGTFYRYFVVTLYWYFPTYVCWCNILLLAVMKVNTARCALLATKVIRWSLGTHADKNKEIIATRPAPSSSDPQMSAYARNSYRDATATSARTTLSTCLLTSGNYYLSRKIPSYKGDLG